MTDKTILILDDDRDFVAMLKTFLTLKGFLVVTGFNSSDIPLELDGIDLILLDINMPNKDGFVICEYIRKVSSIPIIFLTARNNEADKIRGLMIGGDDYITKPFSLEELYARIYTNIRREDRKEKTVNGVQLDKGICRVDGLDIKLTKYEYEIVELLMKNQNQVFSKEKIYDRIWGFDYEGDPQVVSEHIRNIRNKFKIGSSKEFIKTHWGIGYSWIG